MMKYAQIVGLFVLITVSFSANATLINLTFNNGWEVTFDDVPTVIGLGTHYGAPEISGTNNTLVEYDQDSSRVTKDYDTLVIYEAFYNLSPFMANSNGLSSYNNPLLDYTINLSDFLDQAIGTDFTWVSSNTTDPLYISGQTELQSWRYVDTGQGTGGGGNGNGNGTSVPEPTSIALLGLGLLGIGMLRKNKKQKEPS